MTSPSILDLLLRSTVVVALLSGVIFGIQRAGGSAAMRYFGWVLGFAALLALPLLVAFLPPIPLPVLPAEPASTAGFTSSDASGGALDLIQLFYLAVLAGLIARIALGHLTARIMWKTANPVATASHLRLLASLAESLNLRRTVSIRISRTDIVPMTWGVFRPRILLPKRSLEWTDEQWHFVLLHELGHVARFDSAARTAASVICAVYWLNPAIWFAADRMRRDQEHACDDLVLAHGAEAILYARTLLTAARTLQGCPTTSCGAAAIVRRSELESRLVAIVGNNPRGTAGRAFVAAGAFAALGVASLAAALAPVTATAPTALSAQLARQVDVAPSVSPPASITTFASEAAHRIPTVPPAARDHDARASEHREQIEAIHSASRDRSLSVPLVPATPPTPMVPTTPAAPSIPADLYQS